MEISELRKAVHKDLTANKEKERLKRVEKNSKLTEVIVYTKPNNPLCESLKKEFKQEGIKFTDKDISLYPEVLPTVQINSVPIVFVNNNYLVQGRDFQNAKQCIGVLQHIASPDFVNPSIEMQTLQSIKNLSYNMQKSFQGLNRQLTPILQLLNSLREEEKVEQKGNAKKTK